MSKSLLIQHGVLCHDDRLATGDVLVRGGKIARIGGELREEVDEVIDAAGMFVLPGFIDLHAHLDATFAGGPATEGFGTGSAAAVLNGVTTVFSSVAQRAGEKLATAVAAARARAAGASHCDFMWHLTPVRFDVTGWREIARFIEAGFRTFEFHTTFREAGLCRGYDELDGIARRLKSHDAVMLVHCEDEDVLARMRDSAVHPEDASWHALLRPESAEVRAVRSVLRIARKTRIRAHFTHLSTADAAALVHESRAVAPVSGDTAPHYLYLNSEALARRAGHRWLCAPSLRFENTRRDLVEAVRGGYLDAIASDHRAFSRADKDAGARDFRRTPCGVAGIGSLAHMAWKVFEDGGPDALPALVRMLATNPAKIAGIHPWKGTLRRGSDADIVVLNPAGARRPVRSSLADAYETYEGAESVLSFEHVFLRGIPVVRANALVRPDEPRGKCLVESD